MPYAKANTGFTSGSDFQIDFLPASSGSSSSWKLKYYFKKFAIFAISVLLLSQVIILLCAHKTNVLRENLQAQDQFESKNNIQISGSDSGVVSNEELICNCENFVKKKFSNTIKGRGSENETLAIFKKSPHLAMLMMQPTVHSGFVSGRSRETLEIINKIGRTENITIESLTSILEKGQGQVAAAERILSIFVNIQELKEFHSFTKKNRRRHGNGNAVKKTKITIASISCGSEDQEQLKTTLKSAILFSQDAALHVVTFVDEDSYMNVASILLALKWSAEAMDTELTFELHMEWYPTNAHTTTIPNELNAVNWKHMFTKCATQRLFFPKLLPHIDAVIYLDTDVIIMSNLTELWLTFSDKMKTSNGNKLAAASANNEDTSRGYYDNNPIPHYGAKGLNAGLMLMNLTEMRKFGFESKAVAAQMLYEEKISLADQDIINIIASIHPDRFLRLDCVYNFNWIHCGASEVPCYNETTGKNFCFCGAAARDGVKIVHGNGGTFQSDYYQHAFLPHIYTAFQKMDLLNNIGEQLQMIQDLKKTFNDLPKKPCRPLTANILYHNAEKYLKNLNRDNNLI